MTWVHATLEIVGALSILFSVLLILGTYCIRPKVTYEPKLTKIRKLADIDRMCPGKPRGKL